MLVFTQMLETADERLKIEQIFHTYGNLMFHVANKILNNDYIYKGFMPDMRKRRLLT